MSLIEKLKEEEPKQDILCTAMQSLTNPKDIKQFYQEYVAHLKQNGDSEYVRKNPESVANGNIGFAVADFDEKTADRWMKVIPSASHPFYGKDIF